MDTWLKRSTKRIFITLYTPRLLFQQNSYSYNICCLKREATSESSILFLYLLSGLHLRQLLTLTNHSHHECYFSSFLDSDTSILSRLTFFISSKIFGKNHKRYNVYLDECIFWVNIILLNIIIALLLIISIACQTDEVAMIDI